MKDTIFVTQNKEAPFTKISKSFIDNPKLSWTAKAILVYLKGKPNGWSIQITDIINHSTDKETAVRAALKELRLAKHAKIETVRSEGKIVERYWVVSEDPILEDKSLLWKTSNKENQNKETSIEKTLIKETSTLSKTEDVQRIEDVQRMKVAEAPKSWEEGIPWDSDNPNHPDYLYAHPEERPQMELINARELNEPTQVPVAPPSAKSNKADRDQAEVLRVPVPHNLDTEEFWKHWIMWLNERRVKRKAVSVQAAKMQLNDLSGLGVANAIKSIQQSIKNGYQGLFPPREETSRVNGRTDYRARDREPGMKMKVTEY